MEVLARMALVSALQAIQVAIAKHLQYRPILVMISFVKTAAHAAVVLALVPAVTRELTVKH
jgi:hypothetical protein